MIRWIMANPSIRTMYHNDRIEDMEIDILIGNRIEWVLVNMTIEG